MVLGDHTWWQELTWVQQYSRHRALPLFYLSSPKGQSSLSLLALGSVARWLSQPKKPGKVLT